MLAAAVQRVADCMIRRVISQPTERQHVADQIDAAMIFARADFIFVHALVASVLG
jgi:hypothetical protein